MPRRPIKIKRKLIPDPIYNLEKVSKFINFIMRRGKKTTAMRIFYNTMDEINKRLDPKNFESIQTRFNKIREQRKLIHEPLKDKAIDCWEKALKNISPDVEVRTKRVGGASYQIPHEVREPRKSSLGARWLLSAARMKKGKPMHIKLAEEIIAATKNEGEAIKKKENIRRMAEANRAFAHFA